MRNFLLALALGLFVPACIDDIPDSLSPPQGSAAAPSIEEVRIDIDQPAPQSILGSCVDICQSRFDNCLANAQDAQTACLCYNAWVLCRIPCGIRGFLRKC
jgi:hypothetical protein